MKIVQKKYIVFIGFIGKSTRDTLLEYIEKNNKKWEILVLQESTKSPTENSYELDYGNQTEIKKFVSQYGNEILCVTARGEKNIPLFQKIIPFLPSHILTPTVESLTKSTEKTEMRKALKKYNPKITTRFKILKSGDAINIPEIMTNLQFPVIVKPSGLAASLLVQAAYYPEELESILKSVVKNINKIYKKNFGRGATNILIEEIIEGKIYSIDAYIDKDGKAFFTPFVKYKTSAEKGFDDFSLYERTAPVNLDSETIKEGISIAQEGISALGLTNTSAHIELILHGKKWKIVEIGPRIGGYRSLLYMECYNIPHDINDILIRINKKPILKNKIISYLSTLQFFAQKEAYLDKISGLRNITKLESFLNCKQNIFKGGKTLYAKNGGGPIIVVTILNKNKQQFIKDKRKVEKLINIHTVSSRKKLT